MNQNFSYLNDMSDHAQALIHQDLPKQLPPAINYAQIQLPKIKLKDGVLQVNSAYRQKLITKLKNF